MATIAFHQRSLTSLFRQSVRVETSPQLVRCRWAFASPHRALPPLGCPPTRNRPGLWWGRKPGGCKCKPRPLGGPTFATSCKGVPADKGHLRPRTALSRTRGRTCKGSIDMQATTGNVQTFSGHGPLRCTDGRNLCASPTSRLTRASFGRLYKPCTYSSVLVRLPRHLFWRLSW